MPIKTLLTVFERVFGQADGGASTQPHAGRSKTAATLAQAFSAADRPQASEHSYARMAAYLEGTLDTPSQDAIRKDLAEDPAAFQDMLASAAFMERVVQTTDEVPEDLLKSIAATAPPKATNDNMIGPWLIPIARFMSAFAVAALAAAMVMFWWHQTPSDKTTPVAATPSQPTYAVPASSWEKMPGGGEPAPIPSVQEKPEALPPQR